MEDIDLCVRAGFRGNFFPNAKLFIMGVKAQNQIKN